MQVQSIQFACDTVNQIGWLDSAPAGFGIDSGLILSTGSATASGGSCSNFTFDSDNYNNPGDPDMDTWLQTNSTCDACMVTYSLVVFADTLCMDVKLGSDEYPNWDGIPCYNDGFGAWVNGTPFAYIPGTSIPITVGNVSDNTNTQYFEDNSSCQVGGEADGYIQAVTICIPVTPCQPFTLKMGVADACDCAGNTWVFVNNIRAVGNSAQNCSCIFALPGEYWLEIQKVGPGGDAPPVWLKVGWEVPDPSFLSRLRLYRLCGSDTFLLKEWSSPIPSANMISLPDTLTPFCLLNTSSHWIEYLLMGIPKGKGRPEILAWKSVELPPSDLSRDFQVMIQGNGFQVWIPVNGSVDGKAFRFQIVSYPDGRVLAGTRFHHPGVHFVPFPADIAVYSGICGVLIDGQGNFRAHSCGGVLRSP